MRKEQISELTLYAAKLNSLTILYRLSEKGVLRTLNSVITAILSEDPYEAVKAYHKMTAQLLSSRSRRVSGNLFADFVIATLTEDENAFSLAAARGEMNDSLKSAFLSDVQILLYITQLNTEKIAEYVNSTEIAKASDKITDLTSAVWGGRIDGHNKRSENMFPLLSWNYTESEPVISYACDDMLGSVYDTVITGDATECVNALCELFETCGTGKFLRYRLFTADGDNVLSGVDGSFLRDDLLPVIFSEQYSRLEDELKAYEESGRRSNIFMYGQSGMGKTTMCLMTEKYCPGLRFVYVSAYSMPDVKALFRTLSDQPLRFAVIFDDVSDMSQFSRYIGTFMQPENVTIICISDSAEICCDVFDLKLKIPALDPTTAAKYICDISFTEESIEAVRNICMDYQIETKKALGFGAIREILQKIQ